MSGWLARYQASWTGPINLSWGTCWYFVVLIIAEWNGQNHVEFEALNVDLHEKKMIWIWLKSQVVHVYVCAKKTRKLFIWLWILKRCRCILRMIRKEKPLTGSIIHGQSKVRSCLFGYEIGLILSIKIQPNRAIQFECTKNHPNKTPSERIDWLNSSIITN